MVMHFAIVAFAVTVHWPSESRVMSGGHKMACPWFHYIVLLASSICVISNLAVEWLERSDARVECIV
jgi:hypothetical protein